MRTKSLDKFRILYLYFSVHTETYNKSYRPEFFQIFKKKQNFIKLLSSVNLKFKCTRHKIKICIFLRTKVWSERGWHTYVKIRLGENLPKEKVYLFLRKQNFKLLNTDLSLRKILNGRSFVNWFLLLNKFVFWFG